MSSRIECEVSPLEEQYRDALLSNIESVRSRLEQNLENVTDFDSSGEIINVALLVWVWSCIIP